MNTSAWGFTQNPFLNATANSFKKMNILAADHLSRLNAEVNDAYIVPLIARMQPVKQAYEAAYGHWTATKGEQEGETQRFTDMLRDLSSNKIKEWEARIQVVFLEGTADYKKLLPNRRGPFQVGAYDQRISEVYALRESLGAYPPLSALQADVSAYYTQLLNTRDTEQRHEGRVNQASDRLELERVKLAQVMYINLGALMMQHYADTVQVERFFDLELIRNTGQGNTDTDAEPLTGIVAAGSIANVLNGGFTAATIFTISNTGTAPLRFYLAASPTDDMQTPSTGILLQPGDSVTHNALEFGADFMPCLNVRNETAANAGSWELVAE